MLKTGITGTVERVVTEEMTARAVGSGELNVLATPVMIAMVEEAAWRSVADSLEPGQGTVGTKLEAAHTSATPVGMCVRCKTELIEVDRRRLVFTWTASDEAGEIGSGVHERFIVQNDPFLDKAMKKQSSR